MAGWPSGIGTGLQNQSPESGIAVWPSGIGTRLQSVLPGFDSPYCVQAGFKRYNASVPYKDPDRQREYMRKWIAARRVAWLRENGPCADCSTWEDLQVDHMNAAAKVSHRIWSWSEARRAGELAKCVVRCQSCHAKKTRLMKECHRGEASGNAKLTAQAVLDIRGSREGRRVLAVRYGISVWNVDRVRRAASSGSWQHL